MVPVLLIALAAPQLPVAEHNRRMQAYARLPVRPCVTPMPPREAIWAAAEAEGRPVEGCFELSVAAVGDDGHGTYLNSERDYRDPRKVTINLSAKAASDLRAAIGASLGDALVGQPLVVRGKVHRQRIVFTHHGQATDTYDYQTHITVEDAAQIARPAPPPF